MVDLLQNYLEIKNEIRIIWKNVNNLKSIVRLITKTYKNQIFV